MRLLNGAAAGLSLIPLETLISTASPARQKTRNFGFYSVALTLGGAWFGLNEWLAGSRAHVPSTSGTVMLAALPILLGVQLVLGFLSHDMHNAPRLAIHRRLEPPR